MVIKSRIHGYLIKFKLKSYINKEELAVSLFHKISKTIYNSDAN